MRGGMSGSGNNEERTVPKDVQGGFKTSYGKGRERVPVDWTEKVRRVRLQNGDTLDFCRSYKNRSSGEGGWIPRVIPMLI